MLTLRSGSGAEKERLGPRSRSDPRFTLALRFPKPLRETEPLMSVGPTQSRDARITARLGAYSQLLVAHLW
jgi:hypothetical protein